jgi:hypothetical protein
MLLMLLLVRQGDVGLVRVQRGQQAPDAALVLGLG